MALGHSLPAKPERQKCVAPGGRRGERGHAEAHQAQAKHRDDADRPGAAARDRRAVEQQPASGQIANRTIPKQHEREHGPGADCGQERQREHPPRGSGERHARTPRLEHDGRKPDRGRDHRGGEPDGQPHFGESSGVSDGGGHERGQPHQHATPAGYGRESSRPLHRRVDEPQAFGCLFVQRRCLMTLCRQARPFRL